MKKTVVSFFFLFLLSLLCSCLCAQETPTNPLPFNLPQTKSYPDITSQAIVLIFLALLPFLVILLTSFLKIVITLSLLRNALGVQQTPPNAVINGIALILTIYVMFPTGLQWYNNSKGLLAKEMLPGKLISADSAGLAISMLNAGKEPMRNFLIANSKKKVITGFYNLAEKTFPEEVKNTLKPTDFLVIVPAFITSQIKTAFEIGVLIYLPFFVIDIVVSNILLAMQMMMLSPLSIALPIKLLLIVLVDGWSVLLQGLVLSFNTG